MGWIEAAQGLELPAKHAKHAKKERLRIVQFSGKGLTLGVETHRVEGVRIAVTDVARTLVDCFRFRNKIGTDVAVEALRDGWRKKRFTMKELGRYADAYRMRRVIMPYLERLT